MAEFFLEKGRDENWSIPPVEGEILFRVSVQPRLFEPNTLPYIWSLSSVEEIEETGRMTLREVANSVGLSKQGKVLVDILIIDRYLENITSFKVNSNQEVRHKYFRATEFEVNRFLYGVPAFLKLNQKSLNINPRQSFLSWEENIFSKFKLLPESRAVLQGSCRRIKMSEF